MGKNNTIIKDTITLLCITLIAGLLLGAVYMVTKAPIAAAEETAKQEAYQSVYPGAEFTTDDALTAALEAFKPADNDAEITEVMYANGEEGYVFSTQAKGYGGAVKLAVGIKKDGDKLTILGLSVLDAANETPGLGAKVTDESQPVRTQFNNMELAAGDALAIGTNMEKISGASITSGAVQRAVNAALKFASEN